MVRIVTTRRNLDIFWDIEAPRRRGLVKISDSMPIGVEIAVAVAVARWHATAGGAAAQHVLKATTPQPTHTPGSSYGTCHHRHRHR